MLIHLRILSFYLYIRIAPTAASQRVDESPLTYLNKGAIHEYFTHKKCTHDLFVYTLLHIKKGQYYSISLRDSERFDGDIYSVVSINFHDESHRSGATDYWKFWLTQQKDADKARAVEIGTYTPLSSYTHTYN